MAHIRKPHKYDAGLTAAIESAGGCVALAGALGVVPSAVTNWSRVPPMRALDVARITGIPLHELRPDLWAAPEAAA